MCSSVLDGKEEEGTYTEMEATPINMPRIPHPPADCLVHRDRAVTNVHACKTTPTSELGL